MSSLVLTVCAKSAGNVKAWVKGGGARVIYYTRLAHGEVVLVAIYAKAKFDNMPVEVLKSWKEAYDA
jgi:hypothetical protein